MLLRVTDKLYRGPRPDTMADLRELGFERVISLQSGSEDCLTDSKYEHEDPSDFGIEKITFRWSNIFPPTYEQVRSFLKTVRSSDKKTLVHCHSGVDRTGFAIACYRMQDQGWDFQRAYEEWVEKGRHIWFFWWKYYLVNYEISFFRKQIV